MTSSCLAVGVRWVWSLGSQNCMSWGILLLLVKSPSHAYMDGFSRLRWPVVNHVFLKEIGIKKLYTVSYFDSNCCSNMMNYYQKKRIIHIYKFYKAVKCFWWNIKRSIIFVTDRWLFRFRFHTWNNHCFEATHQ